METKYCRYCGQDKPLDQFSMKNAARGTRQSRCKACFKIYATQYHQANKATRNPAIRQVTKAQRDVLSKLATSVRHTAACTACGRDWAAGADIVLVPAPELTDGRPMSEIIRAAWSTERFKGLLEDVLRQDDGVLCRTCLGKRSGGVARHSSQRRYTAPMVSGERAVATRLSDAPPVRRSVGPRRTGLRSQ